MSRTVRECLAEGRPTFSFEFFPPKTPDEDRLLWQTIRELESLHPSFVSVTYGAGGSTRARTIEITENIASDTTLLPVAHLTAVNHSVAELRAHRRPPRRGRRAQHARAARRSARRPERRVDRSIPTGVAYASRARRADARRTATSASVSPRSRTQHPRSASLDEDTKQLVAKFRAGADYAITQMFFDADDYLRLRDRVSAAGCDVPIIAGLMPVTNIGMIQPLGAVVRRAVPRRGSAPGSPPSRTTRRQCARWASTRRRSWPSGCSTRASRASTSTRSTGRRRRARYGRIWRWACGSDRRRVVGAAPRHRPGRVPLLRRWLRFVWTIARPLRARSAARDHGRRCRARDRRRLCVDALGGTRARARRRCCATRSTVRSRSPRTGVARSARSPTRWPTGSRTRRSRWWSGDAARRCGSRWSPAVDLACCIEGVRVVRGGAALARITVAERPTRAICTVLACGSAAVSTATWPPTVCAVVWAALGVVGIVQVAQRMTVVRAGRRRRVGQVDVGGRTVSRAARSCRRMHCAPSSGRARPTSTPRATRSPCSTWSIAARLRRGLTTVIDTLGLDADRRRGYLRRGARGRDARGRRAVRHRPGAVPRAQPRARPAGPGAGARQRSCARRVTPSTELETEGWDRVERVSPATDAGAAPHRRREHCRRRRGLQFVLQVSRFPWDDDGPGAVADVGRDGAAAERASTASP